MGVIFAITDAVVLQRTSSRLSTLMLDSAIALSSSCLHGVDFNTATAHCEMTCARALRRAELLRYFDSRKSKTSNENGIWDFCRLSYDKQSPLCPKYDATLELAWKLFGPAGKDLNIAQAAELLCHPGRNIEDVPGAAEWRAYRDIAGLAKFSWQPFLSTSTVLQFGEQLPADEVLVRRCADIVWRTTQSTSLRHDHMMWFHCYQVNIHCC